MYLMSFYNPPKPHNNLIEKNKHKTEIGYPIILLIIKYRDFSVSEYFLSPYLEQITTIIKRTIYTSRQIIQVIRLFTVFFVLSNIILDIDAIMKDTTNDVLNDVISTVASVNNLIKRSMHTFSSIANLRVKIIHNITAGHTHSRIFIYIFSPKVKYEK